MTTPDRPVMTEERVRMACDEIHLAAIDAQKQAIVVGNAYGMMAKPWFPSPTEVYTIRDLAIEALRKREQSDDK